jgi:hypothetical protein
MARILRRSTFLEDPVSHEIVSIVAGQELPDWAEKALSGAEHLFVDDVPSPAAAKAKRSVEHREVPQEEPGELETPARTASAAAWRKFAKHAGVTIPKGASRDDIVQRVLDAIPDLDIED